MDLMIRQALPVLLWCLLPAMVGGLSPPRHLHSSRREVLLSPLLTSWAPPPAVAVPDDGLTFSESASGLKFADVRLGKGDAVVAPNSRVTIELVGRLVGRQGWKFENTRDDDEPYRLQLGKGLVIAGLEEGLQGMKVGGYRRLVVPSRLAYGVPAGRSLEPIPRSFDFQQRLYSTVLNPTRVEQESQGLQDGADVTGIVQLDVVVLLIRPPPT